ncbi:hypothetical protein QAD02_019404 [Eretmocerus hayati]|uniref:Uncharacterized protein n=1 Tax=Eretmocerus hayati TaxID=131215 RepID=A0ACC2PJI4_9HYME|nr:hypothetical protein QAD02_019404 [Eretmocerus hayati]
MCSSALVWITTAIIAQAVHSSAFVIEEDGIFQVSIWRNNKDYKCIGSIVSAYTIITTSSCTVVPYWQELTIYAGTETPATNGTAYRIETVESDPRYITNREGVKEFDMAVVNLIEPINLGVNKVYAIKMLDKGYPLTVDMVAEVSAFDKTSKPPYTELLETFVELYDYHKCDNELLHSYDGPNQICAGEPGVSLCYGELGAPLVIEDNGTKMLAGFASWATIDSWCLMADKDKQQMQGSSLNQMKKKEPGPIIFSSVPYFRDFILENGRFPPGSGNENNI